MSNYYIYVYLDPRKVGKYCYSDVCFTFEPFYMGKGKDRRWKRIDNRTKYFKNKINKIRQSGLEPIVFKLYENLNENESFEKEINLINEIKKINQKILLNMTDGGDGSSGYKHTKNSKKLMSEKKIKNFNYIKQEFEKRDYTLLTLESEYKSCHQKLQYICPKGHTNFMSWSNFNQGYGCPIEGREISNIKQKRRNFSDIKNEFEKRDYKLLTEEKDYKNAHDTKLEYINKFDEIKLISWHHFQQKYKIII